VALFAVPLPLAKRLQSNQVDASAHAYATKVIETLTALKIVRDTLSFWRTSPHWQQNRYRDHTVGHQTHNVTAGSRANGEFFRRTVYIP